MHGMMQNDGDRQHQHLLDQLLQQHGEARTEVDGGGESSYSNLEDSRRARTSSITSDAVLWSWAFSGKGQQEQASAQEELQHENRQRDEAAKAVVETRDHDSGRTTSLDELLQQLRHSTEQQQDQERQRRLRQDQYDKQLHRTARGPPDQLPGRYYRDNDSWGVLIPSNTTAEETQLSAMPLGSLFLNQHQRPDFNAPVTPSNMTSPQTEHNGSMIGRKFGRMQSSAEHPQLYQSRSRLAAATVTGTIAATVGTTRFEGATSLTQPGDPALTSTTPLAMVPTTSTGDNFSSSTRHHLGVAGTLTQQQKPEYSYGGAAGDNPLNSSSRRRRVVDEEQRQENSSISLTSPATNASAEKARSSPTAASRRASIVPCKARGMPTDHNAQTAFFIIPNTIRHGEGLLCSHSECQKKGIRFVYCRVCQTPAAKINFSTRHRHDNITTEDLVFADEGRDDGKKMSGRARGSAAVKTTITNNNENWSNRMADPDRGHQMKRNSEQMFNLCSQGESKKSLKENKESVGESWAEDVDEVDCVAANTKSAAQQSTSNERQGEQRPKGRTNSTGICQQEEEKVSRFLALLERRPPTDDYEGMSAWISEVVRTTEPDPHRRE